ncbi:MAG: hypothetical protein ABSD48_16520 [Armatimonadota bacterium]|jgi:hypothetical protein
METKETAQEYPHRVIGVHRYPSGAVVTDSTARGANKMITDRGYHRRRDS